MARRSFFATGASGHTPAPLRTLRTSNPSSSILWSPVSTDRAATWTQPAMLAVGAMRSRERLRLDAALVGDEPRHSLVGKRSPLQHEDGGVRGLRVADSLVELTLDAGHAAGRSRAHREVPRRVDRPAGILAGHARRHRMIGGDLHGGEPEAAQVDARERHRGQAGQTDLGQPPAGLEPAGRRRRRSRAPGRRRASVTATPRSAASAASASASRAARRFRPRSRLTEPSRHEAPRFRAGLTSTHASRSPNAPRSPSARARAAALASHQREHRRPPGALADAVSAARQGELGRRAAGLGGVAAALVGSEVLADQLPGSR